MASSNPPSPSVAQISQGLAGVTLSTALVQGELIKLGAPSPSDLSFVSASTTTVVYTAQSTPQNTDGTSHCVSLTVPAGSPNGAAVGRKISGTKIGVRYQEGGSPYVDVIVDGMAFPLVTALTFEGIINSGVVTERYYILPYTFSDTEHTVTVALYSDPAGSGGATQTLTVMGFLAERRAGNTEPTKGFDVIINGLLTASAVGISRGSYNFVAGIWYTNTSASPVTVTLNYASAIAYSFVLTAAGTSGCSQYAPLPGPTTFSGTHLASTTGVVEYIVFGAN
jgi:hypothetical protein